MSNSVVVRMSSIEVMNHIRGILKNDPNGVYSRQSLSEQIAATIIPSFEVFEKKAKELIRDEDEALEEAERGYQAALKMNTEATLSRITQLMARLKKGNITGLGKDYSPDQAKAFYKRFMERVPSLQGRGESDQSAPEADF